MYGYYLESLCNSTFRTIRNKGINFASTMQEFAKNNLNISKEVYNNF